MKDKDKIRLAIRVYLCANRGRWFNSRQLSEFINEFKFGGRSGVTSANIARLMTGEWLQSVGIVRERKDKRHIWHYKVI